MTYKITETVETIPWPEGLNNAPAEIAVKAKQLTEAGTPAIFGKVQGSGNWVILCVSEQDNKLFVAYRS